MSSDETRALLLTTEQQQRRKEEKKSLLSPLKAATAIAAVSTSIFATATTFVAKTHHHQPRDGDDVDGNVLRGRSMTHYSSLGGGGRVDGVEALRRGIATLGMMEQQQGGGFANNEKVTLTVGCSHADVLKRLPFDPEGWDSKVGAKLITESKSKTFAYEDAIEMKEIGCGKFQSPYKLGNGAKFGFYLYEKANPKNYVSDIGGKLMMGPNDEDGDGGGVEEAATHGGKETTSTDYAAQAAAAEQNVSERAKEISALLKSASVGKKKKHSSSSAKKAKKEVDEEMEGDVSEEEEEEGNIDVENNKPSSKKNSSSKTMKGSKKSDPAAVASDELESSGIEVVGEYFDWGWWMSALSQGSQYQTTDITCENTTCTMQVCEKTKCTEYKKECETTAMCDDLGDFVKEQTASMGKSGITKKQAAKALDEATKASSEVSEFQIKMSSKKSHHRHLLSSKHHSKEVVEDPAATTTHVKTHKNKHFSGFGSDAAKAAAAEEEEEEVEEIDEEIEEAKHEQEEEEEEEEEKVSSKSKKSSSKRSSSKKSSSSSKHHKSSRDDIADTGANEFDTRHPAHIASKMSSCTTQHVVDNMEFHPRVHGPANANHVYIFGGCYSDRDHETCKIPVDVNPKQCVNVHLNDKNFQEAVDACLEEAPIDGKCVEYGKKSKYGILPRWDVTRVHNMQKAFADTEFNGYLGTWDTSNVRNMNQMFANNKNFNGDIRKWSFEHLGSATGIFDGADKFNAKWECGFKATGIIDFSSCQSSQTLKKQNEAEERLQRSHFVANPEYNPEENTVPGDAEPQSSATAFDDENAEKYAAEREQEYNDKVDEANPKESSDGFFQKLFGGGSSSSAAPKEEHELPTAAVTTSVSDDGDDESSSEQQRLPGDFKDDESFLVASGDKDNESRFTSSSYSSSSSSSPTKTFTEKELSDANFRQQVALCLAEEPKKGDCMDNEFGPMISWDTSKVTNMYEAFKNPPELVEGDASSSFNGDLSRWDTSHVTNMRRMFSNAKAFQGGVLNKWDTSHVKDMSQMFSGAISFDGDIASWDTSRCEDMHHMFEDAKQFNQDIGKWQVGKALKMSSMFRNAESFDHDLRQWSVAKVTDQDGIFKGASAFNDKFTCTTKHNGPIPSCKTKSEMDDDSNGNVFSKIFG